MALAPNSLVFSNIPITVKGFTKEQEANSGFTLFGTIMQKLASKVQYSAYVPDYPIL